MRTPVRYRHMPTQVLLAIVTLGVYAVYWYWSALGEMERANGKQGSSGLTRAILLLVPVVNVYVVWRFASEYSDFVEGRYSAKAMFILSLIFDPVVWFLVQRDLNRVALARTDD